MIIFPHRQLNVIKALEERLISNAHKGNSWKTCDVMWLRQKLHEEYAEVVLDFNNPKELADLSNITNMLLWRYSQ